jgi:hypothetical protein
MCEQNAWQSCPMELHEMIDRPPSPEELRMAQDRLTLELPGRRP